MCRILLFFLLSLVPFSASASEPQEAATTAVGSKATSSAQCLQMTERAEEVPTSNRLQILNITPAADSVVRKSTVLVVDLAFDVKDFDSGRYIVAAQFDTNTKGHSTDGSFNSYPPLRYASGSYRLCFPLKDVWSARDVKRPFTVRFLLNKMDDAHHSHSIALTDRLSFPAE